MVPRIVGLPSIPTPRLSRNPTRARRLRRFGCALVALGVVGAAWQWTLVLSGSPTAPGKAQALWPFLAFVVGMSSWVAGVLHAMRGIDWSGPSAVPPSLQAPPPRHVTAGSQGRRLLSLPFQLIALALLAGLQAKMPYVRNVIWLQKDGAKTIGRVTEKDMIVLMDRFGWCVTLLCLGAFLALWLTAAYVGRRSSRFSTRLASRGTVTIGRITRQQPGRIEYAFDGGVGEIRITGSFRHHDRFAEGQPIAIVFDPENPSRQRPLMLLDLDDDDVKPAPRRSRESESHLRVQVTGEGAGPT